MASKPTTRPRHTPPVTPPGFRPTTNGLAIRSPNFPATEQIATGVLMNRARSKRDGYLYRLPLFIEGITTGYALSGDYGQAAGSRTFYPHNFSQAPVVISGTVANQYEYDKIVHFVRQHHHDALDSWVLSPDVGNDDGTQAIEFIMTGYYIKVGKTRTGETIYREIFGGIPGNSNFGSSGVHLAGYITSMDAGHERFQFAMPYQISIQVSHDYLADAVHVSEALNKEIAKRFLSTFNLYGRGKNGNVIPPIPIGSDGTALTSQLRETAGSQQAVIDQTDAFWQAHGVPR